MAAHRSGAAALTLDARDKHASKTARVVCPLLRSAAEAYDPEHDGLRPDEVRELLCTCAVSRDDVAKLEEKIERTPGLGAGDRPVTAEALCDIVKEPRNGPLLAEFNMQLEAYRAQVTNQFMAGLGLKNIAASSRSGRRGAVGATDDGLANAADLASPGFLEMMEKSTLQHDMMEKAGLHH